MRSIPQRELRNNVSEVLRQVEAGERLLVTVNGRPVAELHPYDPRPRSVPWDEFWTRMDRYAADLELAGELRELFPETTDDLPRP